MEGFKGLFTSGNCNTQGQVGSNANQFKQFMGSMNQTAPQLANIKQAQGNQNLDQLIQNFDQIWLNQNNSFQQEMAKRQQSHKMPMKSQQPMRTWNADFVSPNFLAMQQAQQKLLSKKESTSVKKCPFHSVKFNDLKINQEDQKEKEKREQLEEKEGLDSARALIEMMENDGSSKFANSDFLKFLKKIDKKEIKIKDNKLIKQADFNINEEAPERLIEKNFEKAFAEAEEEFIKETKEQVGKIFIIIKKK